MIKKLTINTGEAKDRSDMIVAICKYRALDLKKTKEMLGNKTMTSIQHIFDLCKQEKLTIINKFSENILIVELEVVNKEPVYDKNPADHVNVPDDTFEVLETSNTGTTDDFDEENEDEDPF